MMHHASKKMRAPSLDHQAPPSRARRAVRNAPDELHQMTRDTTNLVMGAGTLMLGAGVLGALAPK